MERRLLERSKVSTTVYLSVPGGRLQRCRAKNLSAMGVFLEIRSLGLPAGTVVNLVFAVSVRGIVRLHRRKAVVAHVTRSGAGLMMQGRGRSVRTASHWSPAKTL
jgi:PilZ domain